MSEDFAALFEGTDYRVRLARGGWATIRIGVPLPAALREQVGERSWGFITAWNPHAQVRARQENRIAQRQLLQALRASASIIAILPAAGVGRDWREPSLFAVGADRMTLDSLATLHEQLAYVHGTNGGAARLRWTPR